MTDNHIKIQTQDNRAEGQIILYKANESLSLEVKVDGEHNTVWLTQSQMANLFGKERSGITKHLKNIFTE